MIKWLKNKFQLGIKKTVQIDIEKYIDDDDFIKKLKPQDICTFIQYTSLYKKSVQDMRHHKRMLLEMILTQINGEQ